MKSLLKVLALAAALSVSHAHAADKVSLRLNFQVYGFHSIFYIGQDKGFYKEEGIDLTIGEGQGSVRTVQTVGAKSDTFGVSDGASVILGAAAGAPITAFMGVMNQSPFAIITRAESNIKTLKDLEGKTIAATTGEAGLAIFPAIVQYNKLNNDAIKFLRVDGATKVVALLEKRVDAMLGGMENQTFILEQRGTPVNTINYKDVGVNTVGLVIHAHNDTISKNPDLVRRFVRATQKSIAYAEKNHDEALASVFKIKPDLDKDMARKQLVVSIPLIRANNADNQPLGYMDKAAWALTLDLMKQYRELKTEQPASSFYTNQFLTTK
jgi:NitT/TauT family transport system substrate-binding protein